MTKKATPRAGTAKAVAPDKLVGDADLPDEEPTSASEDQAVAEEAPAPTAVSDSTTATSAPEVKPCVLCGQPAIYETDGRAAAKVAYCGRDLPANITPGMVEHYRVVSQQ